jgi:hypothetical protein
MKYFTVPVNKSVLGEISVVVFLERSIIRDFILISYCNPIFICIAPSNEMIKSHPKLLYIMLMLVILLTGSAISGYWLCKLGSTVSKSTRVIRRTVISDPTQSIKITTKLSTNNEVEEQPLKQGLQTFFIIPEKGKVGKILEKSKNWKRTNVASKANFIWVQNKQDFERKTDMTWGRLNKSNQLVNHLEYERQLGHKGRLLYHLHQQYGIHGYKYMQSSYRLWKTKERNEFYKYLQKMKTFHPWIAKIPFKDNGNGIEIISNQKELNQSLAKIKSGLDNSKYDRKNKISSNIIMQKYLTNPLLTSDNKKFDLRVYFLIASIDPLIVFYHDGYLRVALDRYDPTLQNKRGHLTNANIQKLNNMQNYKLRKESTRRNFNELKGIIHQRNDLNSIRCSIEKALVDILVATKKSIYKSSLNCPNCFSLLGADFMVDNTKMNNVWISEVQSGPGLPTNTKTTKNFFNLLLPNVISIINEINIKKKMKTSKLWPIKSIGNFHLIVYNETTTTNTTISNYNDDDDLPLVAPEVMIACHKK